MEKLKKIIKEVITESARKEALEILTLTDKKGLKEFIKYYKENNFNICCLHLDKLKYDLIKENKMKYNKKDHFGRPFIDFDK